MNEKAHLKRIAAQNKRFQAAIKAQKQAIDTYKAAKRAEDEAFIELGLANSRVDREKYLLVCAAIGQKPEPEAI